jgi:phosphopantothenoylcysteine decarboxylase/phosphopantothenate--cysteine ligase
MNILLGIGGGIAAYKACEIVRALKKRGDEVRAVMTRGAREFVQPLTVQVLTENPVGAEIFDAAYESEIGHIDLARWADVVLIAPATANIIGRLAGGLADDLLSTVILATRAPVVLAPSMNTQMWFHPLVQRNLDTLRDEAGYLVIRPDSGELACKEIGPGRLPDPPVLLDAIDRAAASQILAGKSVVVSAGATREFIDPARFISNPSTGRMGYALARAAWVFGAEVTLVSGPTGLDAPAGARLVEVTSAREMHEAIMSEAAGADFVCKTAAVADFRPADSSDQKLEKSSLDLHLALEPNPDILAELGRLYGAQGTADSIEQKNGQKTPFLIGFAAETHDVVERASAKRLRKGAHMIVANQIGGADSAFGADTSEISIISDDRVVHFGPATKVDLARDIWREAVDLAAARPAANSELS